MGVTREASVRRLELLHTAIAILSKSATRSLFRPSYLQHVDRTSVKFNVFFFSELGDIPRIAARGTRLWIASKKPVLEKKLISLDAGTSKQLHLGRMRQCLCLESEADIETLLRIIHKLKDEA